MSKHKIELTIDVDDAKAVEKGHATPDEWTGMHDVVDAFTDGVITDGEVSGWTEVQA